MLQTWSGLWTITIILLAAYIVATAPVEIFRRYRSGAKEKVSTGKYGRLTFDKFLTRF